MKKAGSIGNLIIFLLAVFAGVFFSFRIARAAEYLPGEQTLPVLNFTIDEEKGSIEAMNADTEHKTECYGSFTIEMPKDYTCEYGSPEFVPKDTYELAYIRGRGNTTWKAKKKPYKIKLESKADLFHMGKNKHWVLLADYYDPSHMRNKVAYAMAAELSMPYTPESVYVEVVMNGEYLGSYLLAEQIRVDTERVAIDDLEDTPEAVDEETISGGYLLSMYPEEGAVAVHTKQGFSFGLESPSFEDYENEAQYAYISDYIQKTEDAIYGTDFTDADGISYSEYMDVDAAADYYLLQQLTRNQDAFRTSSIYLYKERNGKLYWGPVWDFDFVALGNNKYLGESYARGSGFSLPTQGWFERLLEDSAFVEKLLARWPALKEAAWHMYSDGGQIDAYADEIRQSMKNNATLYGTNYVARYQRYTFDNNVAQLKSWLKKRTEWMDANLETLMPGYVAPDKADDESETAEDAEDAADADVQETTESSESSETASGGSETAAAAGKSEASAAGTAKSTGTSQASTTAKKTVTLKKGDSFTYKKLRYRILSVFGSKGKVELVSDTQKSRKSLKIPDSFTYKKITFSVTAIKAKALYKHTALKSLVIGKNVAVIGSRAFYGCKKLSAVTIRSTKLKLSDVGSKAFKGLAKKCSFKVPKKKKKAYKKLILKRGGKNSIKIKTF